MNEFFGNDYEFILTSKFKSDLIVQRFSQDRQMRSDRCLVGPWEVIHLEEILSCRALIKEDISFWKEGLTTEKDTIEVEKWNLFIALIKSLDEKSNEIMR